MAKKKEEKERPDEVVLPNIDRFTFPVCGREIDVKPWSWGTYTTEIAPLIEEIFDTVETTKLDLSNLRLLRAYVDPTVTEEDRKEYDKLVGPANSTMMRLMAKVGKPLSAIVEKTTELTDEEIADLNPSDIFYLCLHIYFINPTVLGNVFQPFADLESGGQ